MAICNHCGAHLHRHERALGLCYDCQQKQINEKQNDVMKNNLVSLQEGRAKAEFQRIYDAFVRAYPDALLTAVGCNSSYHHIVVYLEDKPMYYVTFDPLRNSVNLEPYDTPSAATAQAQKQEYSELLADRANTLACAVSLFSIIGALVLFVFSTSPSVCLFFGVCSIISLIGSIRQKGSTAIIAGILMALCGLVGDSVLILPGLLVIYGGMRF